MYQIGDLVRIKDNFWLCQATARMGYNNDMKNMQGEVYKIRATPINGCETHYRLDVKKPDSIWGLEHDWVWDEAWLEPVTETTEIKDVYTEELDLLFMGD